MKFEIRRIVLFTVNLDAMILFYSHVLGLRVLGREDGWIDFSAGSCNIALHRGVSTVGSRPPKLVFYAEDVAGAREVLIDRGARKMGKVISTGDFNMCDGKDPDGNRFQISSRK